MRNLTSWENGELSQLVATHATRQLPGGVWFDLSATAASKTELNMLQVRVYDLTLAGNAFLVLMAVADLRMWNLSYEQRVQLSHLIAATSNAMECATPVCITAAQFVDLNLAPYVDKEDFDAVALCANAESERPESLCVFPSANWEDFRADVNLTI
jgi:hypothetical protein